MFPGELSCGLVGVALLLSHAARLAWPAGVPLLLACAALAARIPARAALLLSHAARLAWPAGAPLLLACAALAARIPARAALLSADAALLVGPSPKPPLSLPLPSAISTIDCKVPASQAFETESPKELAPRAGHESDRGASRL